MVDLTQEIEFIGRISQALNEISVRGRDSIVMANVFGALDQLSGALREKQQEQEQKAITPANTKITK